MDIRGALGVRAQGSSRGLSIHLPIVYPSTYLYMFGLQECSEFYIWARVTRLQRLDFTKGSLCFQGLPERLL